MTAGQKAHGVNTPYRPVVRFLAVAGIVFGVMMLGIDWAVGMPLPCPPPGGWLDFEAALASPAAPLFPRDFNTLCGQPRCP
jgi:hypothetical protein